MNGQCMFLIDLLFDDLEASAESKVKKNSGVNIKKYGALGKDTAQNGSLLVGGVGKGKKIPSSEIAKVISDK